MKKKCVVLLSSGLDSSVNLAMAMASDFLDVVLCLTFDYGQRAASKEIQKAKELSEFYKVPHQILSVPWLGTFGHSSLTDLSLKVPTSKDVSIDDRNVSEKTAQSVWVPNRNGILLNIAAGFAESLGASYIIPGFNIEEAATFPDNSLEYMQSLDKAFRFSTKNKVEVKCFTAGMNKIEIVSEAKKLNFPFEKLWPCYFAGEVICGECESCQRYLRALKENNLSI